MEPNNTDKTLDSALVDWLSHSAPFGVLVTDADLTVTFVNGWFARNLDRPEEEYLNVPLVTAFPEMSERRLVRYYYQALTGQSSLLSHRLHKYIFPMQPTALGTGFTHMQQSARISPLKVGDRITGTITVIEDVSERVGRESGLAFQIKERERLLAAERQARSLAEEHSELKGSYEALMNDGLELIKHGRTRSELLHRIITSQEEERKRIARDIHDQLGQQLTALRFALWWLKENHEHGGDLAEGIDKVQAIARKIDSDVDFIAWQLRPVELDDLGLESALRRFVADWSGHYNIDAEFHSSGLEDVRLIPDFEINLYRIAQEALSNVAKHANASRVSVLLETRERFVTLIIEDDGVGFDAAVRPVEKGMGLLGMRERVSFMDGTLEVESERKAGTSVYIRVPRVVELSDAP